MTAVDHAASVGASTEALEALVTAVVGRALPGEQLEAVAGRSTSTRVRAYEGAVEDLSQATTAAIGIRVVVDGRQGFATAGSLDQELVEEALAEARDNARHAAPDEANGLAAPDGVEAPVLDLLRPELAAVDMTEKIDLALELERRARAGDPRVRGVRSAVYADAIGSSALATSTGLLASSASSSCHLAIQVLAGDGDETQTGHGVSVGRTIEDLDLEEAAGDAVERALRLLGARKARSQRLTVVLEPAVTASLLGIIGGTLSGEAVLKGRSLFAGRVGAEVAVPGVELVDDPTDAASFGAAPHDGEGLASRRTPLLRDGVLQGYLHNTWSARRSGATSTASAVRGIGSTPGVGPRALALRPGDLDRPALLRSLGECFLVQGVTGLHSGVNAVSGDLSVGAEGLMVRGGELAEPVREVTIASTIQRMLLDVVAVGADVEHRPSGTTCPSVAIADVSLSGS